MPGLLSETEQLPSQFMFHLRAIECPVDREAGDYILAMEYAAALLHVVEFDGEAVGGGLDFRLAHQQRGWIAEVAPPVEDWFGAAEVGCADSGEDAQNIEVGKFFNVVAGGAGAVEDD